MAVFSKTTAQSHADVETEAVGYNVVLTRMRGHMTRALAERGFEQFRSTVAGIVKPNWIVETLELTGFDPGAVAAGSRWFGTFKDRGGDLVIFVSQLAAARMAAASLAFAVHARIRGCDSLKEGYDLAGLGQITPRPSMYSLK